MDSRFVGSNAEHPDKYAQRAQTALVKDTHGRVQDPLYRFWRMTPHVLSFDIPRTVPRGIDFSDDEDELDPPPRNVRRRVAADADVSADGADSDARSDAGSDAEVRQLGQLRRLV
jgi:hypothetical protein